MDWGDGSARKMLVLQAWRPESDAQNPCLCFVLFFKEKPDMVMCTCNPRVGNIEIPSKFLDSLTSQLSILGKFQDDQKLYLKKTRGRTESCSVSPHTHTHTCEHITTYMTESSSKVAFSYLKNGLLQSEPSVRYLSLVCIWSLFQHLPEAENPEPW